ncbi:MAG TPA: IS4 family transposase [Longimicrobiaceae bacterium]|nr:IS4 family transposase [Longimicrobiaceae bacterium]
MHFSASLDAVAHLGHPDSLEQFRRDLDPAWIEAALQATGTATLRKRRLPAEQVIWLVLGMALFRDRSIVEVAAKLDLALPGSRGVTASPSAISQARKRVGEEPLAWLFERTAAQWAHTSAAQHRWRGLALYGLDGTTLRVPDSPENRTHFGSAIAGGERGISGYPLVRGVALMALRSHLVAAACFGPYGTDERVYARELLPLVPEHSLLILDRNYPAPGLLLPFQGQERHWLVRGKKNLRYNVLVQLGPGDAWVEMKVSREARKANPELPKTWRARAIAYQREGHAPQLLLTSLLDAKSYPAKEIIALYHERWEIELGYDELKTEMLEREEALRSKSPEAISQELWGLLLVYNLVRLEMERTAAEAQVEPVRISFVAALRLIRDEWLWCAVASPGAIPRHLQNLRRDLKFFLLPERRIHRSNPRAVKLKMSNYDRKRPTPPAPDGLK